MKKSRYSESQIIKILKEGESGMPVTDICENTASVEPNITNGDQNMEAWISTN